MRACLFSCKGNVKEIESATPMVSAIFIAGVINPCAELQIQVLEPMAVLAQCQDALVNGCRLEAVLVGIQVDDLLESQRLSDTLALAKKNTDYRTGTLDMPN